MLLFIAVASFAESAPLSEADLKNLLAGIRANRTTQADFQEERLMRVVKKPIVLGQNLVSAAEHISA